VTDRADGAGLPAPREAPPDRSGSHRRVIRRARAAGTIASVTAPVPTPAPGAPPDFAHRAAGFLIRRPITVFMLFLTLLGTGVIAYQRIPLTLLPRGLSSTNLSVWLPFPGAGPQEVQDQLTRPVEDSLRTIPGVSEIVAFSSEGGADIVIEFSEFVDMDVAYGEVRDRIERIRGELPDEMDRYAIRRWNSNTDMPVMWMGVQYDEQAEDPFGPLERIAIPRLEGADGVAQVRVMGIVDEAVRIFVDAHGNWIVR
jgi:HAE1 family hydrophobic/amphiphilic exporter-1